MPSRFVPRWFFRPSAQPESVQPRKAERSASRSVRDDIPEGYHSWGEYWDERHAKENGREER